MERRVYYSPLFEGNKPLYYEQYGTRAKGMLSAEEKRNLLIAISALTLCLTMVMFSGALGLIEAAQDVPIFVGYIFLVALLSTGTGFAMHELAHKYIAQRYNCWAEFRYSSQGLLIALVIAAAVGFLFAAPGAVYIVGRINERQNGLISIAGPATNVVVALAMFPLVIFGGIWVSSAAYMVAMFNAFLALFNMIPIMPLDGSKVMQWNMGIYIASIAMMGILLITVLVYLPGMIPA